MSAKPKPQLFPRGALIGAALLIATSIGLALVGRLTDMGATRATLDPPVKSRDVLFEQRPDGAIAVKDAQDGRLIRLVTPGRDGFIEVVMRGLGRTRLMAEADASEPFRLMRHADGRLTIVDPATGKYIKLSYFGADNAASFARLLEDEMAEQ